MTIKKIRYESNLERIVDLSGKFVRYFRGNKWEESDFGVSSEVIYRALREGRMIELELTEEEKIKLL